MLYKTPSHIKNIPLSGRYTAEELSARIGMSPQLGLCFVILAIISLLITGCGENDDLKTAQGLQEENRVLREEREFLKDRLAEIKAKMTEDQIEHEAEVAELRQKIATLEHQVSTHEKLEISEDRINRQPRLIEEAKSNALWLERVSYAAICFFLVASLVLQSNRRARERQSAISNIATITSKRRKGSS